MAHPLKSWARALQETAREENIDPPYTRCLRLVEEHLPAARASIAADLPPSEKRAATLIAIYDLAKEELAR